MGLFLQTAAILDCGANEARQALKPMEARYSIDVSACKFEENSKGVLILFSDHCSGYDDLALELSAALQKCVLLAYIYDEDFWGYYLCVNGALVDTFSPMPDYFEEVSAEDRAKVSGNSTAVANAFGIPAETIGRYLTEWTDEMMDDYDKKSYADDEYGQCDCWQIADFLKRLDFPYLW